MANEGRNGVELVSAKVARRRRCCIMVFVTAAVVVSCTLVFFILQFALATQEGRMDIGIKEPWYLRRDEWFAQIDSGITLLELPVANVLIGHTSLNNCSDKYSCIKNVLRIQQFHQGMDWQDIGPNYLVGGNGFVFEGRRANVLGSMVRTWNRIAISIMFLGDYREDVTYPAQFDNVNALLKELVMLQVLKPDYVVYGHCQVIGPIISPGPNIMDNMQHFDHWNPANKSNCLRN